MRAVIGPVFDRHAIAQCDAGCRVASHYFPLSRNISFSNVPSMARTGTLYRTERFEGAFSPMYFRRIGSIVFPIATRSMTASVCSHAPCTAKTATSRPIGGSLIDHPGRIFPTARNYASQR